MITGIFVLRYRGFDLIFSSRVQVLRGRRDDGAKIAINEITVAAILTARGGKYNINPRCTAEDYASAWLVWNDPDYDSVDHQKFI